MIVVTSGVVLSRKRYREYERIVFIYSKTLGKIPVRFAGVDRPRGKLKALSEPMVHAEYRLYQRSGSAWWTATGGHIINSFPNLRLHLDRTLNGLEMCELLMQLTPDNAPSLQKFDLITEYLELMETSFSPWLTVSFGLKLLRLAGLGPDTSRVPNIDHPILDKLLAHDPDEIASLPRDSDHLRRIRAFLERHVEENIEGPLKSRLFRESLSASGDKFLPSPLGETVRKGVPTSRTVPAANISGREGRVRAL